MGANHLRLRGHGKEFEFYFKPLEQLLKYISQMSDVISFIF